MTIKQNLKRFFITSVLISSTTIIGAVGVYYSLYFSKNIQNKATIDSLKSKYNNLLAQETSAKNFLDQIENSSDEKKRNFVKVINLEQDAIPLLAKISESNDYFDLKLNKIELDSRYVNVAHIFIDLDLKDKNLGNEFYNIYGKIFELAFQKIKNDKIRELVKINDKQYKVVYKKEYI